MSDFAADCSNWGGEVSDAQCGALHALGVHRVIVGLQNRAIAQQQIDTFARNGFELEVYQYMTLNADPAQQVVDALDRLEGRAVGRFWIDCEDEDRAELNADQVVDFIVAAANACSGRIWSGIYTRRDWWLRRTENSTVFASFPLWDCTNDKSPDLSFNPYGGWVQQEMEQYAFDVPVAGFNVDLNIIRPPVLAPPAPSAVVDLGSLAAPLAHAKASIAAAASDLDTVLGRLG